MNTLLGAFKTKTMKNNIGRHSVIFNQKVSQRTETLFAPQTVVSFH